MIFRLRRADQQSTQILLPPICLDRYPCRVTCVPSQQHMECYVAEKGDKTAKRREPHVLPCSQTSIADRWTPSTIEEHLVAQSARYHDMGDKDGAGRWLLDHNNEMIALDGCQTCILRGGSALVATLGRLPSMFTWPPSATERGCSAFKIGGGLAFCLWPYRCQGTDAISMLPFVPRPTQHLTKAMGRLQRPAIVPWTSEYNRHEVRVSSQRLRNSEGVNLDILGETYGAGSLSAAGCVAMHKLSGCRTACQECLLMCTRTRRPGLPFHPVCRDDKHVSGK